MAIVITGIIVGAVGATLITSLRSNTQASAQMRSSRDAQLLSQYLLGDVQSAGPLAADATGATTGTHCLSSPIPSATARNVLHLSWTEASFAAVTPGVIHHASYWAFRPGATGPWTLVRYSCAENGPPSTITVLYQLESGTGASLVSSGGRLGLQITAVADDQTYRFEVLGRPRTPRVAARGRNPAPPPPPSYPNGPSHFGRVPRRAKEKQP
jgi:hypothetical protein